MRSGDPLTQVVEFSHGAPDGVITWVLLGNEGTQVATGTITPAAGDVSAVVTVSGSHNTIAGSDLYENRELRWSYLADGTLIAGVHRYRIEAFLKFGVSCDGVRNKLGLEDHELQDGTIDLVTAYASFEDTVTKVALDLVTSALGKLHIRNAIEALAALAILPSLQLKVASKEVSGVSQFQRGKVDWEALSAHLNELVATGYTAVDPNYDEAASFGTIFAVVVRTDPITGE